MKKNIPWFTLIEVIIATWIITIAVFWVYKLISENTKIISNSTNYTQSILLFPVLEQCIENIWIDNFLSSSLTEYRFNFWNSLLLNECYTGSVNPILLDNIEYIIEWEVLDVSINYIDWELKISSESNSSTWFFKQIKK
jgi:hypothetical protein